METWNERLALALRESAYNPNQLATEIGVRAPTIAAWIGAANITPAQNITADNLFKVCEKLKVRPEWVLYRRGPKNASHQMEEVPEAVIAMRELSQEMEAIVAALCEIDKKGGQRRTIIIGSVGAIIATTGS
ncbi:hypothetical protein [Burkholderia thailandensis]|uniref:hypothetical protein n=1 Tax=Burkholderia thailandensis TaxID=57975 RepID=UPI00107EA7F6|nr:hypothetical protein [Burkholderia thailandensis]TGB34377.1 hypothetical protein C6946_07040 [Burkholderia thailandensis]